MASRMPQLRRASPPLAPLLLLLSGCFLLFLASSLVQPLSLSARSFQQAAKAKFAQRRMFGGGRRAVRMGASGVSSGASRAESHWMDVLKHGGAQPTFDVLEKTKEFVAKSREGNTDMYADDYVFRGPVVGPISNADVQRTQGGFQVLDAYPDLQRNCFGYHIDPDNPFKCLFFERWNGTHTGLMQAGPFQMPPSGKKVKIPTHVTAVHWNPQGKVMYQCISAPIDRFEGNTKGVGAVFGLLQGAGLEVLNQKGLSPQPGNPLFIAQQKIFRTIGVGGKAWSEEHEIPKWWKSKAVGGEDVDI